jgi:hypothetical protein
MTEDYCIGTAATIDRVLSYNNIFILFFRDCSVTNKTGKMQFIPECTQLPQAFFAPLPSEVS